MKSSFLPIPALWFPSAIAHCGLQVKLCDLAPDDFDLDMKQLASLVTENTLAVLPTHLGGRVANIGEVKKLAAPFEVTVIEDAAQALGAMWANTGISPFTVLLSERGCQLSKRPHDGK